MAKFNCRICGKEFERRGKKAKTAKFCSFKCAGISRRGIIPKGLKKWIERNKKPENYLTCERCGRKFYVSPSLRKGRRFCSIKCRDKSGYLDKKYRGRNHWNWKEKTFLSGYAYVWSPNHPNKTSSQRVAEHRLVMEKHLGRYLTKNEEVHHINGIKDDNRIKNLELVIKRIHHGKTKCPYCQRGFKVK